MLRGILRGGCSESRIRHPLKSRPLRVETDGTYLFMLTPPRKSSLYSKVTFLPLISPCFKKDLMFWKNWSARFASYLTRKHFLWVFSGSLKVINPFQAYLFFSSDQCGSPPSRVSFVRLGNSSQ
jgi:hypothetical protein